jgi:alkylation response protein AidB-like acyl-CoA dehydrogenase
VGNSNKIFPVSLHRMAEASLLGLIGKDRGEIAVTAQHHLSEQQQALARVDAVQNRLVQHSDWSEQACRLHDDSFAAIVEARVPRLFLPAGLGGDEVNPMTCALVCEEIAASDTAAAWHIMVFNAAKLMAAKWPAELVEALWGDQPDRLVAASGHTPLKGKRVEGGIEIWGTQRFVSGCNFAEWIMSPILMDGEMHNAVIAIEDCQVQDNWNTLGMRGSGSNDVLIDHVRVPSLQVVPPAQPDTPVNPYYQGALYQCPSRIVFATYVPVALSLAKRAIDEVALLVKTKTPGGGASKLTEKHMAQGHFGRALALYRSARLMFYNALEITWQRALDGREPSPEHRADLYLAGTHAVQTSAEVVRLMGNIAGTTMTERGHPLDRINRDMETLRHHGFVNESRYASVAQVLWGAELDYPAMLR